jgi:hypothetical protein
MPLTKDAQELIATARLDLEEEGLSAFPSERDQSRRAVAVPVRHPPAVTMRVAPIAAPTAWLMVAILLLGICSAVAIGVLAGTAAHTPYSQNRR